MQLAIIPSSLVRIQRGRERNVRSERFMSGTVFPIFNLMKVVQPLLPEKCKTRSTRSIEHEGMKRDVPVPTDVLLKKSSVVRRPFGCILQELSKTCKAFTMC